MKKSPHAQGSKPVSPAAPVISTPAGGDAASLAAMDTSDAMRVCLLTCNKLSAGLLLAG
jgi:hypothetical protein